VLAGEAAVRRGPRRGGDDRRGKAGEIVSAKKFLGNELSLAAVSQYFPRGESLFEEVNPQTEPT
jgi:hypothetical protein